MATSNDTEREALTEVIASTYTVFSDDHGELADAILAEFMPDHDERVRAEQREADITVVVALTGRYGTRNYEDDNYASGAGDALDDATTAIREASDE